MRLFFRYCENHRSLIFPSLIQGYTAEDEYIACQGPKEETTYDFWRMIDECDVKIIVMLTELIEQGKVSVLL